jgi:hypothetical protein
MASQDCQCENEAEVLYNMYKRLGTLANIDIDTPVCCRSEQARMVISGKTLTLTYSDGTVATYTEQS